MILNGCIVTSVHPRPCKAAHGTYLTCFPRQLAPPASLHVKSLFGFPRENQLFSSRALPIEEIAVSRVRERLSSFSTLTRGDRTVAKASKDVPYSYRYPAMTKKPKWWWRTLACIPYLMPLHETWMYAETAYHLHPFLEDFEFLTYPFLGFIGQLPNWFLLAYFFVAYLGIVRRKEWPHFFRFHVVMGMLLEIALQVTGTVSRWLPQALYWGKIGMHFWTAIAFAFLFTVLECMRSALSGMYADVPFVCDAAYIQIPYD